MLKVTKNKKVEIEGCEMRTTTVTKEVLTQSLSLPEYNPLVCFNLSKFKDYQEARLVGAVYKTGPSIDALKIQYHSTTGLVDLCECVHAINKCLYGGRTGIACGIVTNDDIFLTLDQVAKILQYKGK